MAGGRLILCKNFGFVLTLTPSVNGFGELQALQCKMLATPLLALY